MFLFVYSFDPRCISVNAGRHKHDQEDGSRALYRRREGSLHALGLGETLKSELRQVEPVTYDTVIPPFGSIRLIIIRESDDQRLSNMYRGLRCQAESTTRSTRSMSL